MSHTESSFNQQALMDRAEKLIARRLRTGLPRKVASAEGRISSLGTARDYRYCLISYFEWLEFCGISIDQQDHKSNVIDYLEDLAETVSQSTVSQHRQALKLIFQIKSLPMIRAIKQNIYSSRSYTWSEVKQIAEYQRDKNALATLIAYSSGLRAHELATIRPVHEQPRSDRKKWRTDLFEGVLASELFSVVGKGGLIRHVVIPIQLTKELEQLRHLPRLVKDRNINYLQHYKIGSGQAFSQSFSTASQRCLKYSLGAHGLRHSYVKRRIRKLLDLGFPFSEAQLIVSQEVGHFRPSITFCYMR